MPMRHLRISPFVCFLMFIHAPFILVQSKGGSETFGYVPIYSSENSTVLTSGVVYSTALIETKEEISYLAVGGYFHYLNHSDSSKEFGNIALYSKNTRKWTSLGFGCDDSITSLVVVQLGTNTNELMPTIIASGNFTQCYCADDARTAISFPEGVGFYDLKGEVWYNPTTFHPIPQAVTAIKDLKFFQNSLYAAGNSKDPASLLNTGYVIRTKLVASDTGRIKSLNWIILAKTIPEEQSVINTIEPTPTGCYVGGLFQNLISPANLDGVLCNNIALIDETDACVPLLNGVEGEIYSISSFSGETIFIAGNFTKIRSMVGSIDANNVAKWNGGTWNSLGDGIQLDTDLLLPEDQRYHSLQILAVDKNVVIVGGSFARAGGVPVNNIAMWRDDVSSWLPLGNDSAFENYRVVSFDVTANADKIYSISQEFGGLLCDFNGISGIPAVEHLIGEYNLLSNSWSNFVKNEFLIEKVVCDVDVHVNNVLPCTGEADIQGKTQQQQDGTQDRAFWVETLMRIADPVLINLSNNTLKKNLPNKPRGSKFAPLEAVGRLACGIAPWLELGPDDSPEGKLRDKYIKLTVKGLKNAVNPNAPDYLVFGEPHQALVDAAFLAHGLLRAPKQLWGNLDSQTKEWMTTELKRSRGIRPYTNNWLLFASMVEAALLEFTGEYDMHRLSHGVKQFRDKWYKGDALYGDGSSFHMDYYNSFVIHPMLTDVLIVMKKHNLEGGNFLDKQVPRLTRYAEQLERFISPEGTYPVVGRSIVYRFGAFQALAQASLMHLLPKRIKPAQVRSAMTAVIRKQLKSPENFDADGWLRVGFTGEQIAMSEGYINTGSVYLCASGLLSLGLPITDEYWSAPYAEWTNLRAWTGSSDVKADSAWKQ